MQRWRLIDSGLRPVAQQAALTRTVLEARCRQECTATVRFFTVPDAVVIGVRDCVEQVVDIARCRSTAISITRGLFAQHAFVVGKCHLAWELHIHDSDVPGGYREAFRRAADAVAAALVYLGADVRLDIHSKIRAGRRTVAWYSSLSEGATGVLQGWITLRAEASALFSTLRIPATVLSHQGVDPWVHRRGDLSSLVGKPISAGTVRKAIVDALETEFDVEFSEEDLTLAEDRRYGPVLRSLDTGDWVDLVKGSANDMPIVVARIEAPGRDFELAVMLERPSGWIRCACFVLPDNEPIAQALMAIEDVLVDVPLPRLERVLDRHASGALEVLRMTSAALADQIRKSVGQTSLRPD